MDRISILENVQRRVVNEFDIRSAPIFHGTGSRAIRHLIEKGFIPGSAYRNGDLVSRGDLFVIPSPYHESARKLGKRYEEFIFRSDYDNAVELELRSYAEMNEFVQNLFFYLGRNPSNKAIKDLLDELSIDPTEYLHCSLKELWLSGLMELLQFYCKVDIQTLQKFVRISMGKGFIIGLSENLLQESMVSKGDDTFDLRLALPKGELTINNISWIMPLGERETLMLEG